MSGQTSYGKGDKPRPRQCSYEEWGLRWDLAMGYITQQKYDEKMKELKKKGMKK
jgi:hypothetical protein